jgi:hypothetical protein
MVQSPTLLDCASAGAHVSPASSMLKKKMRFMSVSLQPVSPPKLTISAVAPQEAGWRGCCGHVVNVDEAGLRRHGNHKLRSDACRTQP